MIAHLGRRLVEGTVGLFAVLGFIYVPLGRRTGFEHACAVLTTPAAHEAYEEIAGAALDLRLKAAAFLATPTPSASSRGAPPPRPVPPRLK